MAFSTVDPGQLDTDQEQVWGALVRFEARGADPLELLDQTLILDGGPVLLQEALRPFADQPPKDRPDVGPPDPSAWARLRGDDPIRNWTDVRLSRYLAISVAQMDVPNAGVIASAIRESIPEDQPAKTDAAALTGVLDRAQRLALAWDSPPVLSLIGTTRDQLSKLYPLVDRVQPTLEKAKAALPDLPELPDVGQIGGVLLVLVALTVGYLSWSSHDE